IGWVVGEERLIAKLALAKQSTDLSGSLFNHAVALELIEGGIEATLQPAIIAHYRARRDALCAAASEHLGEWFTWQIPPGGMFVWMEAKDPRLDTDQLYRFALAEKVAFVPSSVFDPAGAMRSAMRVNFSRNPPDVIEEGVQRLARAVRAYLKDRR